MFLRNLAVTALAFGLLAVVPALAQTSAGASPPSAQKQKTEGPDNVPSVGPASQAYKQGTAYNAVKPVVRGQKADGPDNLPSVGPGSQAFKQRTDGPDNVPSVGPASQAYKQ